MIKVAILAIIAGSELNKTLTCTLNKIYLKSQTRRWLYAAHECCIKQRTSSLYDFGGHLDHHLASSFGQSLTKPLTSTVNKI